MKAFFSSTVFDLAGPLRTLEAATRSSLSADRQRAKTLSPIRVSGMPRSSAEIAVHLPVPFWPAVSRSLVDHRLAVFILLGEDGGGDLDEVAVEFALVPFGKNL